MTNLRLRYVQVVMKDGRRHHYFRRPNFPRVTLPGLPGLPGSADFMIAYRKALAAVPLPVGADRLVSGSMQALAAAFYRSSRFTNLRPASQATYRRLADKFNETHGHKLVADLEPHRLYGILDEMSATPAQANALRNVLRQMLQFAFERGWRSDNPARDVRKLAYVKKPFTTWTEDHIAAFEAHWPNGTRARLSLALLLFTGQRRSDVRLMGPQHVRDGRIEVTQIKTGARLSIPMHRDLRAAIDAMPAAHLAFLVTEAGKPFASGNALYNRFMADAQKAGLPAGLSPHGLRKSAATRLAQAGCSPHEIASITGHATLAEVERYTKEVNRSKLATAAVTRLEAHDKGRTRT